MQSIKIKGRLSNPALDKMTKMTLGDNSVMEYFGADIIISKTDKEQYAHFMDVLRQVAKDSYPNMNPDRFIEQVTVMALEYENDGSYDRSAFPRNRRCT